MKKSKYVTITNKNIHLIAFRIKKFIESMETIGMKSYYPDRKRIAQISGDDGVIKESQASYLNALDYQLEVDNKRVGSKLKDKYIRINFQQRTHGMLINIGSKIRITPTRIYIHAPNKNFPKSRTTFPLEIWTIGDFIKCANATSRNKRESDFYWKEVEQEWADELNDTFFINTGIFG